MEEIVFAPGRPVDTSKRLIASSVCGEWLDYYPEIRHVLSQSEWKDRRFVIEPPAIVQDPPSLHGNGNGVSMAFPFVNEGSMIAAVVIHFEAYQSDGVSYDIVRTYRLGNYLR